MDSSSPSFTHLPPPPPNPNPNPHPTNNHHPATLHTTLQTLKHLLHITKTTLHSHSLSPFLPTTTVSTCPYNSNHHLPPSSLFHHHLTCPSSPSPIDLSLLQTLTYPNTLHSPPLLINNKINKNNDVIILPLNNHHTSLSPNFFYLNSPSVVTFPYNVNNNLTLILPSVILTECENADINDMSDTIDKVVRSYSDFIELLPSECFNVRLEVNEWSDYPSGYSLSVARLIVSRYGRCEGLGEWILVNSVCYGVVIDVHMRDHVLVLFSVCFKAVVREAVECLSSVFRGELGEGRCRFECRVLGKVLRWLGEQFGILYGNVNGKLFAVNMFKQWLLISLSESLFVSGVLTEVNGIVGPVEGSEENNGSRKGMVSVSQVAAAVAALHERVGFERKIKAIRASRFVPAYQRVQEHQYISKLAEEERKKRPDYRPIIEHDGVLWHRGGNQDGNKNKSQEELLAEERDYKRRRMSYRGKKMKRSTTQVMRDIIDEYMEEIRHANIAGQPSNNATNLASEPTSMNDVRSDKDRLGEIKDKSHRKESHHDSSMRSGRSENEIKEKCNNDRHDEHNTEYFTNDRHRSTSRSRDHGQRDEQKHSRKYYPSSPDRGHSRSHANRQRSKHRDKRSSSIVSNEFEDRYDPSES